MVEKMIYDCFLFFNELDLLKLRLNILDPVIDFFVITESTITFSGVPKPLYYNENKNDFKKYHHKIIHNIIDDTPDDFSKVKIKKNHTDLHKLDLLSFEKQWLREIYQRDSLIDPLMERLNDEDLVIISDLDEIPNPRLFIDKVLFKSDLNYHLRQKMYMYYLNLFKTDDWFGTRVCSFSYLKRSNCSSIRQHTEDKSKFSSGMIIENGGWHFSYLGGEQAIINKIKAFSHQEYNNKKVLSQIQKNVANQKDIFGRILKLKKVELDESYPEYLLKNIPEYTHLILPQSRLKKLLSWFKK